MPGHFCDQSNPSEVSEVGPDIDKLREIDVQAKPSDVEANAIVGNSNCKPVDLNKDT